MSDIDTGGPVYPQTVCEHPQGGFCPVSDLFPVMEGMTLRDHFAGLAMQGAIAYYGASDDLCRKSYETADAMIAARKERA